MTPMSAVYGMGDACYPSSSIGPLPPGASYCPDGTITINTDPTWTPTGAAIVQGTDAGGNSQGVLSVLPNQISPNISNVLNMPLPNVPASSGFTITSNMVIGFAAVAGLLLLIAASGGNRR